MLRSPRFFAIAITVFAFVAISVILAFGLTAPGRERQDVTDVVKAQAANNPAAMLSHLKTCQSTPGCADQIKRLAAAQKRPGQIEILRYDTSTQLALTERVGVGRVVWRAGTLRPVVQCVRVRRKGPLQGAGVELLSISAPIPNDGNCPGR